MISGEPHLMSYLGTEQSTKYVNVQNGEYILMGIA
jgi:hypothetical protein